MQRPSYKVFNYTLAAGEQVNIHHTANSLNCLSATARFQIAFDDAPLTTFEKGLGYQAEEAFSKVRLLNDGTETITIELGFASGGVTDSRLNLPSAIDANITNETLNAAVTNEVNVKVKVAATIADKKITATANARTLIVEFNAGRKELIVSNLGSDTVYLGGATVADKEGLPLGSGKTAALTCKAEIRAYNPNAAAIDLAVLDMIG